MRKSKAQKSRVLYDDPMYKKYQAEFRESQKKMEELKAKEPPQQQTFRQVLVESAVQAIVSIITAVLAVLWLKGRM